MHSLKPSAALVISTLLLATTSLAAQAQDVIFTDNFNSGASPLWGNEVGNWAASGGVYVANSPVSPPLTYSSLPYTLTNFSFDCDVNALKDGGVWLRSTDNANGVLLVTGGDGGTGTGLYWHIVSGGSFSGSLNGVDNLFVNGVSSAHLHITVVGDTYSVYVNGNSTPATTLTTDTFASGKVALYENANSPEQVSWQTFDNVTLTVTSTNKTPTIEIINNQVQVCWVAASNTTYRVEVATNSLAGQWQVLTNNISGTGSVFCVMDPIPPTERSKFYRVVPYIP